MLKRKQNIKSNRDWLTAYEKCTNLYSESQIETDTEAVINQIRKIKSKYNKVCSGWCAGKDSVVLQDILKKSGIDYTPVFWRGINEYPDMTKWIENNKPHDLLTIPIKKFSLDFLNKNPELLFCPKESRNKWMAAKWQAQRKTFKEHNFDLFICGRRTKDGNNCGTKEDGYIKKQKGYDMYSPLAEWSHEEILAYIKYANISLPPFYSWERGFLIGSIAMGEWTERSIDGMTEKQVWDELWEIDKTIIINASEKLNKAKEYLKEYHYGSYK